MNTDDITMKPLLSVAIHEALRLALKDSALPEDTLLSDIDTIAVAKNLCLRLLGSGGWMVRGAYAGNATPQEILHACIENPTEDPLGKITEALGLVTDPHEIKSV